MAEYISRDDLLNVINENVAEAHNERCSQLLEAILNAPTADVVEVVRCKDCRHRRENVVGSYCLPIFGLKRITDLNAYCSYGERRDA